MAINKSKTMVTLIALLLMVSMAASLVVVPLANAHVPPMSWPT
jgi:hypothetical protein